MTDTPIQTPELNAEDQAKLDDAIEQARGFFNEAKDTIADALASALEAVKRNPKASAAIATGAAAAVAGAAVGIAKLIDSDKPAAKRRAPAKPKSPATKPAAAKRAPARRTAKAKPTA